MYSKILIPLDGSKFVEAVLPYGRMLATELNIPVDLLCVNDPHQTMACAPYMVNEYLASIGESFGARAGVIVESGHTAATIVELAAAQPDMLIAMATHGYTHQTLALRQRRRESAARGSKSCFAGAPRKRRSAP